MKWIKLLWNINNPEGCRQAVRISYQRHLRVARARSKPGDNLSPHHFGLYGALSARYKKRGLPVTEGIIRAELIPFLLMSEPDASEALAEYVVYREYAYEADVRWLSKLINEALRTASSLEELLRTKIPEDAICQVAWRDLLDPDVKKRLDDETGKLTLAALDENAVTQLKRGEQYSNAGRYPEAIDAFLQALRIKPDYAEAHFNMGLVFEKSGRHQEAITALKQALRIKPYYAQAHFNLGVVYEGLTHHQEAIAAYKQAFGIQPDFAEAHYALSVVCRDLGRYQEAVDALRKFLCIRPDHVEAHVMLGTTYSQLGRHQEAIAALKQALHIQPDFIQAHAALGTAYVALGDRNSALNEYRALKNLNQELADQLLNLICDGGNRTQKAAQR
jgi:tetratricopeptide (TPR) repeat protein